MPLAIHHTSEIAHVDTVDCVEQLAAMGVDCMAYRPSPVDPLGANAFSAGTPPLR